MENIIFILITLCFILLMFTHVYQTNQFFIQLKTAHQEVWNELGQPRWRIHFGDNSFQNAMKYIRSKKFSDLQDPVLESIYKKIKKVEAISMGLAVIIFIISILDIVVEG